MSNDSSIGTGIDARIERLEELLERAERNASLARSRGEVENPFSRYMYLHNAFQDHGIIPLWVKPGTPGIHAQYNNRGAYTTWDSVMEHHRNRPSPVGKLSFHYRVCAKYGIDFLKQDEYFDTVAYCGEDGKPKFLPQPDAAATSFGERYQPDGVQELKPVPPAPYESFGETFEY